MEIPKYILSDFLEPLYSADAQYLLSAEDIENGTKGNFSIPQSVYTKQGLSSGHLNMIDLLICFNQLAYTGLAYKIRQNTFRKLEDVTYESFKDNKLNGLICSLDDIKFRETIDSTNFLGEINFERIMKRGNNLFIKTTFCFEAKVSGNIGLAMKLN